MFSQSLCYLYSHGIVKFQGQPFQTDLNVSVNVWNKDALSHGGIKVGMLLSNHLNINCVIICHTPPVSQVWVRSLCVADKELRAHCKYTCKENSSVIRGYHTCALLSVTSSGPLIQQVHEKAITGSEVVPLTWRNEAKGVMG